jgi:hypothetical protein
MWNTDLTQMQQYYEKAGRAKGKSHMREGGQKKEVKNVNMVDVSLYENECRILKPVEINIKRGLRQKEEK